jgi:glycerol kinase
MPLSSLFLVPAHSWVEQDPLQILATVRDCIERTCAGLDSGALGRIRAIGITNQRETTIAWDKTTGKPLHNAIGEKPGRKERSAISWLTRLFTHHTSPPHSIFFLPMILCPPFNPVWNDARTADTVEALTQATPSESPNHFTPETGLPLSTYFSAVKARWLFDHIPEVRQHAEQGTLAIGTVDCWLMWVSFALGKKKKILVHEFIRSSWYY